MKKNLLVLTACVVLILLMSQTYKSSQVSTICTIARSSYDARLHIERQSVNGYRVVTVTSFAEVSNGKTYNEFLIVMEKR